MRNLKLTEKKNKKKNRHSVDERFRLLASVVSAVMGSPWSFIVAIFIVILWGASGPVFHFSETWQLVINTGTTIITFLMVFLIQNTQNRDVKAIHLKLDEIIRGAKGPRNRFVDLEDLSDEELDHLAREFQKMHETEKAKSIKSAGGRK